MAERNGTDRDGRGRADLVPFARWLAERMRERRLGRNQLAEYLGVSQSSISEYARALRRPRLETLRKLAVYFAVPLEDLEALLPPEGGAVMAISDGGSGTLGAPADPAGRLVPTVLLYNPDGAVVGRSGLDDRERAAVLRVISTIDAWRAGRGDGDDGGIDPGAGDPR